MAALLEILYLTVPGAYLKDVAPTVGTTGTPGRETGIEAGNGERTTGGGLRAPAQPTTNPESKYQCALRYGIFMYSRLGFFGRMQTTPSDITGGCQLAEQPVYKPGPVGLHTVIRTIISLRA